MTRVGHWLLGALAIGLVGVAAGFWIQGQASEPTVVLPAPPPPVADGPPVAVAAPEASAATREEKRFRRYDKDRNARVSRDEYLASRHKAYAKLDTNGDGVLGFEEYAVKQIDRFEDADADGSGELVALEFEKTRTMRTTKPKEKCPPA
jgi:hypothetical protein